MRVILSIEVEEFVSQMALASGRDFNCELNELLTSFALIAKLSFGDEQLREHGADDVAPLVQMLLAQSKEG